MFSILWKSEPWFLGTTCTKIFDRNQCAAARLECYGRPLKIIWLGMQLKKNHTYHQWKYIKILLFNWGFLFVCTFIIHERRGPELHIREGVGFKHVTLGCKGEVCFLAESVCKSTPCLMLLWSRLLFTVQFLQVSECSWPVRQAPSLHNLYAVCKNMHNWLQQNPKNVCVIHCMVSRAECDQIFRPVSLMSYCMLHI